VYSALKSSGRGVWWNRPVGVNVTALVPLKRIVPPLPGAMAERIDQSASDGVPSTLKSFDQTWFIFTSHRVSYGEVLEHLRLGNATPAGGINTVVIAALFVEIAAIPKDLRANRGQGCAKRQNGDPHEGESWVRHVGGQGDPCRATRQIQAPLKGLRLKVSRLPVIAGGRRL